MKQLLSFRILLIVCFLLFFICASFLTSIAINTVFLMNLIIFTLPGFSIAYIFFRPLSLNRPFPLIFGFSLGIIISSIINMFILKIFGWHLYTTYSILIAISIIIISLKNKVSPQNKEILESGFNISDYIFLFLICVVLLLLIIIPLMRIGHTDGSGTVHYYYSLFAHDYLMRGTTSYSIITGMPLRSYNLAQDNSHYYFLCYSLLSCTHKIFDGTLRPDIVILLSSFWFSIPFVYGLLFCVSLFISNRKAAYFSVICGLFAYSYNSIYFLVKYILVPRIDWLHSYLSKTYLLEFTGISHGWYRDFLFEPQAVLSLIFFFCAIAVIKKIETFNYNSIFLIFVGILMAGATSSDSALGMMIVFFIAIVFLWEFIKKPFRSKGNVLINGILCFSSAYCFYFLSKAIGLLSVSGQNVGLRLIPFDFFLKYNILYLVIDYGPLFIFGIIGFYLCFRKRHEISTSQLYFPILLFLVCLFFITFVQTTGYETHNISRKATKLIQIPLVIFSGIFFQFLLKNLDYKKIFFPILIIFFGISTLFVDFSIFSGFIDDGTTSEVTDSDMIACDWIRENLPQDCIMQSLPEYGEYYTMSPVIMIGGRAMALGNLKVVFGNFFNQREVYRKLVSEIRSLFGNSSIEATLDIIKKYNIQYIYLGPNERQKYPDSIKKYYNNALFDKVYSKMDVDIFKVNTTSK